MISKVAWNVFRKPTYLVVFTLFCYGARAGDNCGDSVQKLLSEIESFLNSGKESGYVRGSRFEEIVSSFKLARRNSSSQIESSESALLQIENKLGKHFVLQAGLKISEDQLSPLSIEISNKIVSDLGEYLNSLSIPFRLLRKSYYTVADTKEYFVIEILPSSSWPLGQYAKNYQDLSREFGVEEGISLVFDPFVYQRIKLREPGIESFRRSIFWPELGVLNVHPRDLLISLNSSGQGTLDLDRVFTQVLAQTYLFLNQAKRANWSLLNVDRMTLSHNSDYLFSPVLGQAIEISQWLQFAKNSTTISRLEIERVQSLVKAFKQSLKTAEQGFEDLQKNSLKVLYKMDQSKRSLQVNFRGDMGDKEGMFEFKDVGSEEIALGPGFAADLNVHFYRDTLVGQKIAGAKFLFTVSDLSKAEFTRSYGFDVFDRVLVSKIYSILNDIELYNVGDEDSFSIESGNLLLNHWEQIFNGDSSEFTWVTKVLERQKLLIEKFEEELSQQLNQEAFSVSSLQSIVERLVRFDEISDK